MLLTKLKNADQYNTMLTHATLSDGCVTLSDRSVPKVLFLVSGNYSSFPAFFSRSKYSSKWPLVSYASSARK